MPYMDRIFLTLVKGFLGDAFFPEFETFFSIEMKNQGDTFTFVDYIRSHNH